MWHINFSNLINKTIFKFKPTINGSYMKYSKDGVSNQVHNKEKLKGIISFIFNFFTHSGSNSESNINVNWLYSSSNIRPISCLYIILFNSVVGHEFDFIWNFICLLTPICHFSRFSLVWLYIHVYMYTFDAHGTDFDREGQYYIMAYRCLSIICAYFGS